MKKKMIAFVLAALLVCAMAVPASAANIYAMGSYGSSTYEISDTCDRYSFTSYTYCDDHSYYLKSDVSEYTIGPYIDPYGYYQYGEHFVHITYGSSSKVASTTRGECGYSLSRIACSHYVNGDYVHTAYVNAG